MWRTEHVVSVVGGGCGVVDGSVAGVALTVGLEVVFPPSASFNM
jgi:hypothetical protein